MSIRVYALAKDLKIESKDLQDLCNDLNIVTKGKLSSISDEDAERVREYYRSKKSDSAQKAQAPEPVAEPVAPKVNMVMGRVPNLASKPRHSEKESAK